MESDEAVPVPQLYRTEGCVVCKMFGTGMTTLIEPDNRDRMARQLKVLAEDIRCIEVQISRQDKPLFAHQDCLNLSKFSLIKLPDLSTNR